MKEKITSLSIFKTMIKEELFPITDNDGNTIGKASRSECHNGISFLLHPVVHLYVFNSKGELYLQKRSRLKKIQPGKWDTSVGGHVDYGEEIETALLREAREELGITEYAPEYIDKYIFTSKVECELVYIFKCIYDGKIIPNPEEIEEGRFWLIDEIVSKLNTEELTPNFRYEFPKTFAYLLSNI